ncbi:DUF6457 domain-containing protein [Streptomyces sp. NBC_00690]|uniref:DUF6457 domain-containing protein n=1 Tax=Streptomyces sp. NBC_00690 TaxID=2975808 RepID=UPI002E2BBCF6|nr:DUF6457 domain-containing protein [Streptomyces sp. NBC_00690]
MTDTTSTDAFDAIVLAGGRAQRLGGADKPGLSVGGRTLLDRVLAACRGARRTVVVGGRRGTERPVVWAQENPPGGGPVAALDAGLRQLAREWQQSTADTRRTGDNDRAVAGSRSEEDGRGRSGAGSARSTAGAGAGAGGQEPGEPRNVLVLSADLPFLREPTVQGLIRALEDEGSGREGVLLTDAAGREQPLVAVYRAESLRREIALLATEYGSLSGLSLRLLTGELDLGRLSGEPSAAFDCDTWEDVSAARARIREHGHVLDEWIAAVKDELDIELDVDVSGLLDLARDAAHGVARPAAPLTTFLVGYAAGAAAHRGEEAVAEATRKAEALARRWAEEATTTGTASQPQAAESRPAADQPAPGEGKDNGRGAPPASESGPGETGAR